MFKIIGGDQKEYGPVTTEQVRQWIIEGRANAQTLVLPEGTVEWRPLSAFPEFAEALAAAAPPPPTPWIPEACLERDYDLDLGKIISRSWEITKANLGTLIVATLVVFVISMVFNEVVSVFTKSSIEELMRREFSVKAVLILATSWILSAPIQVLLYAGFYQLALKLLRGERASVADVFSGFGSCSLQLVLMGFVVSILTAIGFLLCLLPGIYLAICWLFAVPLIMDKKMDFWAAMELSRKRVHRHWLMVFCLALVGGLISAAGALACCVGLFVTVPIYYLMLMSAYEDIFGN